MMGENDTAGGPAETDDQALPADVIEEAERLTRRAREAVDENEAAAYRERRDELVAAHDYRTRIREDDNDVLVLYPDEWLDDGTVQLEAVEDLDRGIERPLEGAGDADSWQSVEDHNRVLAEEVEAEYGEVHGANAHALADFMSNHYAKHIEQATGEEIAEFCEEYFPRNAWPSDDQQRALDTTIEHVFECTDTEMPSLE
jgi:hypothetical protein